MQASTMVIYINRKNRLQIKSINFRVLSVPHRQHEKLTFKNCFAKISNNLNVFYESHYI